MRHYKLNESEARVLAANIAYGEHKITNPDFNADNWIKGYMRTYDKIMNAIMNYNANTPEED